MLSKPSISNTLSRLLALPDRRSRRALPRRSHPSEILECRTLLSAVGGSIVSSAVGGVVATSAVGDAVVSSPLGDGVFSHSFDPISGTLTIEQSSPGLYRHHYIHLPPSGVGSESDSAPAGIDVSVGVDENGKVLINGHIASGVIRIQFSNGLGDLPITGEINASTVKTLVINGSNGHDRIDLSGVTFSGFSDLDKIRVAGGAGNDEIIGSEFAEVLNGNQGNDTISGGNGHDVLLGGGGDDSLSGGNGHDTLRGHSGRDAIFGETEGEDETSGALTTVPLQLSLDGQIVEPFVVLNHGEIPGNDVVFGGVGNDRIEGNGGGDRLTGGAGSDVIDGHDGDDVISGGSGNDTLRGWKGNDTISGAAGTDTILGAAGNDLIFGGNGNDLLYGDGVLTSVRDEIIVRLVPGTDPETVFDDEFESYRRLSGTVNFYVAVVRGHRVVDALRLSLQVQESPNVVSADPNHYNWVQLGFSVPPFGGGSGEDTIDGEDGDDAIFDVSVAFGGAGNDSIYDVSRAGSTLVGGAGNDVLRGYDHGDRLDGGSGHDSLWGYGGNDTLLAGDGHDLVLGGDGDDQALGGRGEDLISGGAGNDVLNGRSGDDTIVGGVGNDSLLGGAGADLLIGLDGNDRLNGQGSGHDTLVGGSGTGLDSGDRVTGENSERDELFTLASEIAQSIPDIDQLLIATGS